MNTPIDTTVITKFKGSIVGAQHCPYLSDNIPVSSCPEDTDNDGTNNNIDIDLDNDGILNTEEATKNTTQSI
jgi:hypothetical protein